MNPKQFLKSFQYTFTAFELRGQSPVPEPIYDFIDGITRFLYRLRESIKSVIYWFPVIWHDRHWDHTFIYAILQHKLKRVCKDLDGGFVGYEKEVKHVRLCILLLDRLLADNYWKGNTHRRESELIIQDLDLLFDTLRKHIQKWWT